MQKSLVKGATAVVSAVNNLITALGMPSKNEVVNNLMDGVLLLANANMELNVRRRDALRPELHASYRYLCAPSNPIYLESFGDDLPKAVKGITDNNRITSKHQRGKKESYRRGNLVLSTKLIMWIGHRKEIQKLMFRALALRRSESRNCGLCVVYIQKFGATLLAGAIN